MPSAVTLPNPSPALSTTRLTGGGGGPAPMPDSHTPADSPGFSVLDTCREADLSPAPLGENRSPMTQRPPGESTSSVQSSVSIWKSPESGPVNSSESSSTPLGPSL